MSKSVETLPLLSPSPGTTRELVVHRYGTPGKGPKAYFQAALHSDEYPPLLVMHHLVRLLDDAANRGDILGEIVAVPVANPIGLGQQLNGYHVGRYEFDAGGNFNRSWPDFSDGVTEAVAGRLGGDAAENVLIIREALIAEAAALPVRTEFDSLRKALISLSIDADMVFDLHCDLEAEMHLYASSRHGEQVAGLGRDLATTVVLLEGAPGGTPFDEANAGLWWKLRDRIEGDYPFPNACFSVTVEHRGRADVSDDLAAADARGLFAHLQRHGVIAGDPGPLPEALCEPTPLEGCDVMHAPAAGIIAYHKKLGDHVEKGEAIADLIDLMALDPGQARTPLVSRTSGRIFSMLIENLVRPGTVICKIAGAQPLEHRKEGNLLED